MPDAARVASLLDELRRAPADRRTARAVAAVLIVVLEDVPATAARVVAASGRLEPTEALYYLGGEALLLSEQASLADVASHLKALAPVAFWAGHTLFAQRQGARRGKSAPDEPPSLASLTLTLAHSPLGAQLREQLGAAKETARWTKAVVEHAQALIAALQPGSAPPSAAAPTPEPRTNPDER